MSISVNGCADGAPKPCARHAILFPDGWHPKLHMAVLRCSAIHFELRRIGFFIHGNRQPFTVETLVEGLRGLADIPLLQREGKGFSARSFAFLINGKRRKVTIIRTMPDCQVLPCPVRP